MTETLQRIRDWIRHKPASDESPYLVIGLGNPGEKYRRNRHNVGFQCVDHLAQAHKLKFQRKKRFKADLADGQIGRTRVILVKPLTFMNESGQAVAAVSKWYKVPAERILVIYDDLDLPLGKLRVRPNGSSGGHKGIDSIIAQLGTRDFARLRIGIGRPTHGGDPIDYVLNDFGPEQEPIIRASLNLAEQVVISFLEKGIRATMNAYNGGAKD